MFDNFLCEDVDKLLFKVGISFLTTPIPRLKGVMEKERCEHIDRFRHWHIEQHKPPTYGFDDEYEGQFQDINIIDGSFFVTMNLYHSGSPEEHTIDDWKEIVLSIRRDMEVDMGLRVEDILGVFDDSDRQAGSLRMIELYVFEPK